MNLARFYENLDTFPDKPCMSEIRRGKVTVRSFSQTFDDLIGYAGNLPELTGKRVLVFMPPCCDFFVSLLACWAKGGTVLLPNGLKGLKNINADLVIADSKTYFPALAIFGPSKVVSLRRLKRKIAAPDHMRPVFDDDRAALITFTSGSGGGAKEICRTFGQLNNTMEFLTSRFDGLEPADRLLITLPTYVLANFSLGSESVLFFGKKKNANNTKNFRRLMIERNVNGIICSAGRLEFADRFYPKVEKVFMGGCALKKTAAETLRQRFPYAKFRLIYGTSECVVISLSDLDEFISGLECGTIPLGRPVDGVSVAFSDEGEIIASGLPTENQRCFTGDLGRAKDGAIFMLGKKICSDPKHGLYNLAIENEIESMFPELGPVSFLHYEGKNYLFAKVTRRDAVDISRLYPFIEIIRRYAPVDKKHGGKLDYQAAVKLLKKLARQ